ncbi:MAG: V-type ATP synthase subunit I [Candidatus Nanosalina sp.]
MKPVEMTKISVTGPKNQLQSVIDTLYRLELMDIDDYQGDLEKGDPFGDAEELSETLVDIRSLLSKLPETETESEVEFSLQKVQDSLEEIEDSVEELKSRKEKVESEISSVKDDTRFFRKLKGSGLSYEDMKESERLKIWVGDLDTERFTEEVQNDRYEIFEGSGASLVAYDREFSDEIESALQEAGKEEYQVPENDKTGSVESTIEELKEDNRKLKEERKDIREELEELSRKWRDELESAEDFLAEKVEKAEAPINFATTDKTFIAQGWIPEDRYEEVQEELCDAAEGKIHIQKEDTEEEPPVKHDNPRPVKPFESLTDLVSIPKYNELDPSFVILLTFPLMFGFMIGDAGYGLTTLAVFYLGYRYIDGAEDIFKSLMYASVATIIFGLAFGDAFGYVIFGHHSKLAAVTGIHFFKEIPILFHRAEHLGQVFTISAIFGLFHVNAGYLLGFYNEYSNHGFVEAFLEKGSWLLLEASALVFYLYGAALGAPLALISVALLYKGEGVEGIVEIPSLLSNILSYLRIFGVSVAAVALAAVVNSLAKPLFAMGTATGFVAGIALLIFGHTFNTFIKIIEGFLQGIRLHYVEMFSKFYEGGGRKYIPFGAREIS